MARLEIGGGIWLITPMLADAEAGAFGPPRSYPMKYLGAHLCDPEQLSRDKIETYKRRSDVALLPLLVCEHPDGSIQYVFDGWHRLTALQELIGTAKSHRFMAWAVPPEAAWSYRIPQHVMVSAVAHILRPKRAKGVK